MEFATKIGIFHIVCEFQTCRIIDIELRSTSPGKCQRGLEKFFENHQVYSNALNPIEKEERILNCKSCEVFSERNQGFSIDYSMSTKEIERHFYIFFVCMSPLYCYLTFKTVIPVLKP